MKVMITGSEGFVGKALKQRLKSLDHEVIDFDWKVYRNDLVEDVNILSYKIGESGMVIHSAAIADLNIVEKDQDQAFHTNVEGTYNVVKYCRMHEKPMIYISTCCVYGDAHKNNYIVHEGTNPEPIEFYARTKYAAEPIVQELDRHVICRLGTVYGPGMRPALFNYKILDCALNNKEFVINGDGHHSRFYIFIDDLVDALVSTITKFPNKEILNLCGEEKVSLNKVLSIVSEITGKDLKYTHGPARHLGDVDENMNNIKTQELIDWIPKTSYKEGMIKTKEHFWPNL